MTTQTQSKGLASRVMDVVRKVLSSGISTTGVAAGYQPTGQPYLPSHIVVPVDGSRYGANRASLESLRTAEEFTIAVKRLAEGISALEFKVEDAGKMPLRENHPLSILLDQPNPLQDWTNFIETAVYHLLPTGSAYILKNPMSMAGTPLALWLLSPDRTRPIRGDQPTAPIEGYEHNAEDGVRYVFPVEAIIHVKTANPFTPYVGLGASQLIPTTMAMDAASLAFNWNFFKQGGRLSTIIEVEKKMTADSWRDMQQRIQEAYMGYQNAHRLMVLDDGAKLNTAAGGAAPKEIDFPETRKDISRTSGSLLGVPPIHMGHVGNANRSNSVIQDQIFNKQGLAPLARRFSRALTQVAKSFGQFKFEFIMPNAEDPEILNMRATAGFQSGALSPNDVREIFGQERAKDPSLEKHFLPFNMQPLDVIVSDPELNARQGGKVADPNADPTATPTLPVPAPIGGKPVDIKPAAKPVASGTDKLPVPAKLSFQKKSDEFPKGTAIQRRVLRFAIAQRPRTEKRMTKVVRKWILAFGEQAAAAVEGAQTGGQRSFKAGIFMDVVTKATDSGKADLKAGVIPIINDELQAYYGDLADLFVVPEGDQSFTPGSVQFSASAHRLASRVTRITDAVREDLDALIKDGMDKGLSAYEIANGTADGSFEGIRDAFDGMAQERAQLIARTETVAMQDQASVGAYQDMGVKVLDVIGCTDFVIMPGETYGCNSQGIPIGEAAGIDFHPNHNGAMVPRLEKAFHQSRALALA